MKTYRRWKRRRRPSPHIHLPLSRVLPLVSSLARYRGGVERAWGEEGAGERDGDQTADSCLVPLLPSVLLQAAAQQHQLGEREREAGRAKRSTVAARLDWGSSGDAQRIGEETRAAIASWRLGFHCGEGFLYVGRRGHRTV